MQRSAWMQPSENMKPRAELTKSAPAQSAHAARAEVTSLPEPTRRMRSFSPACISESATRGSASSMESRRDSASACGAAPVPPSPPSITRKSGAQVRPRRLIASHTSLIKAPAAQRGLDAAGLAGQVADVGDLVEQLVDIGDVVVAVRADRIVALRNAAHLGNHFGDLAARQHPALARLGALRQLDLEGLHLVMRGDLAQARFGEVAVLVAHAILGGADLHDDVAAALEVERRKPPSPVSIQQAGVHGTARQRLHRGRGNRPEAHAADVEYRFGLERLFCITTADHKRGGRRALFLQHREAGVDKNQRAGLMQS